MSAKLGINMVNLYANQEQGLHNNSEGIIEHPMQDPTSHLIINNSMQQENVNQESKNSEDDDYALVGGGRSRARQSNKKKKNKAHPL